MQKKEEKISDSSILLGSSLLTVCQLAEPEWQPNVGEFRNCNLQAQPLHNLEQNGEERGVDLEEVGPGLPYITLTD